MSPRHIYDSRVDFDEMASINKARLDHANEVIDKTLSLSDQCEIDHNFYVMQDTEAISIDEHWWPALAHITHGITNYPYK